VKCDGAVVKFAGKFRAASAGHLHSWGPLRKSACRGLV
jgi:hypothetical protein